VLVWTSDQAFKKKWSPGSWIWTSETQHRVSMTSGSPLTRPLVVTALARNPEVRSSNVSWQGSDYKLYQWSQHAWTAYKFSHSLVPRHVKARVYVKSDCSYVRPWTSRLCPIVSRGRHRDTTSAHVTPKITTVRQKLKIIRPAFGQSTHYLWKLS